MHEIEIPSSVLAVARAGTGTNNIPVATLSKRGVPVFNSPGANANAVKELVLGGLFLAARNICQAWKYVGELEGDDDAIEEAVEKGKKHFVGYELPGRTLGVVGLGAIGVARWRVLHRFTALGWLLGVLHGIFEGTDAGAAWFLTAVAAAALPAGALLAVRWWEPPAAPSAVRRS